MPTFESAWTRTIARSRDFDKKVKSLSTWRNFSKLEKEEVLDTLVEALPSCERDQLQMNVLYLYSNEFS